jgi:4-hydroxybenzoate polyprenyltransferase
MGLLSHLRALRPQQWSKNVFVLVAIPFAWGDRNLALAGQAWSDAAGRVLAIALAFCLASSAIYLINDILDVESDRRHPEKRNRPIASGEVRIPTAYGMSLVCALASLALALVLAPTAWPLLVIYMGLNLAYSLRLKHVVLVDAFCIASGFLLRVLAGGRAAGIEVSDWLLLCTLFLALFLALNKRRSEIALLGQDSAGHRAILAVYSLPLLDRLVTILAACAILSYALYTIDDATALKYGADNSLVWSVPSVVFGIARYLMLVDGSHAGGNPTKVFLGGDRAFLLNLLIWGALVLGAIRGWI